MKTETLGFFFIPLAYSFFAFSCICNLYKFARKTLRKKRYVRN